MSDKKSNNVCGVKRKEGTQHRYYFTIDRGVKEEFDLEVYNNGGFQSKTLENLMKIYINSSRKRARASQESKTDNNG